MKKVDPNKDLATVLYHFKHGFDISFKVVLMHIHRHETSGMSPERIVEEIKSIDVEDSFARVKSLMFEEGTND
jgi:hypothetical protein